MAGSMEPSRLYLVIDCGESAADRLAAALTVASPSSVLIVPAVGAALEAQAVLPLIAAIQATGAAALLLDDAQLARVTKADGVHLSWSKEAIARYEEARDILGQRFIVGIDAGRSRHDAMELGEAGADYVAFGIPAHVEDRGTAVDRRLDLCAWWSEIFEVPCVAFDVTSLEEAEDAARAGADFVAVRIPDGASAQAVQAFARAAVTALSNVETAS